MMLHWSFGIFHVIQNEFLEFKIFNNSIDRLKAFQEKPSSLFGFQKNAQMKETNIFIPKSFWKRKKKKEKKEKKKALSSVNFRWHFSVFPNRRWRKNYNSKI